MTIESDSLVFSVEFQMSLMLFMALSGYLISSRLGQPAVVGVILAGILIGPSGFDVIHFSDFIASLGQIGAIVLLFAIGLESNIKTAMKPSCLLIALGGVLVPWAAGYAIAVIFGYGFTAAIIIGVALTATSLAITADVLRELGKMQSATAQAIIGAAVLDDILALLALTISEQFSADSFESMIVFIYLGKAAIFLTGGFCIGRYILAPLIARVDDAAITAKYPDFVFIMIMQMSFLYAVISELVGLSAIIGAFVAGISLAKLRADHSNDFRKGTGFLRVIFGAIFFISLGILADVRSFTWHMAGFVLVLTTGAVLSKMAGCGLAAKLTGYSTHDSLIIGVGMSPRGEMAMIIALLALISGVIQEQTFVALVLTSLLTTILAPLLLRNWLYRKVVPMQGEHQQAN